MPLLITFHLESCQNKMSVKIFYGPYEAHGVIRHKEQRLHGVLDRLNELDMAVELVPTPFINVVTVSMRNKQIFRCDIRNLLFNMDIVDDVVAQRLVAAVEEAKDRFYSEENIPHFQIVHDGDSITDGYPSIHYLYIIPTDKERIKAQEEMIQNKEAGESRNQEAEKESGMEEAEEESRKQEVEEESRKEEAEEESRKQEAEEESRKQEAEEESRKQEAEEESRKQEAQESRMQEAEESRMQEVEEESRMQEAEEESRNQEPEKEKGGEVVEETANETEIEDTNDVKHTNEENTSDPLLTF